MHVLSVMLPRYHTDHTVNESYHQITLENNRWIDHIYPPNSHAQVSEFADLWEAIKDTQLTNNMEDDIR